MQKSMFYIKGELLSANYFPCTNRNKLYQIYKIKGLDLKQCSIDEIIFEIKTKLINKGFADYYPGLEFPNLDKNDTKNQNKKYYYFLAFDLLVDIDNVKTICYWTTLQTFYVSEINNNTKNKEEKMEFIGKVRCFDLNNNKDLNDIKIFIDNEIKSMGYIILNIILLIKKESVYNKLNPDYKINHNRFLSIDKYKNETEVMKIYTKDNKKIKSEKVNGEIIEWKFNSPCIEIKVKDLKSLNRDIFANLNFYKNSYKVMLFIIFFFIIIIIIIFTVIKQVNRRNINRLLNNGSLYNNDINFGVNNERVVNNLEHVNQNNNLRNNENIPSIQIPREENENPSNSNTGSPNELNA